MSLEGLLSFLSPTADDLAASYKTRLEQLKEEVRGLSLASLATETAADGAPDGGAVGGGRMALLTGKNSRSLRDAL